MDAVLEKESPGAKPPDRTHPAWAPGREIPAPAGPRPSQEKTRRRRSDRQGSSWRGGATWQQASESATATGASSATQAQGAGKGRLRLVAAGRGAFRGSRPRKPDTRMDTPLYPGWRRPLGDRPLGVGRPHGISKRRAPPGGRRAAAGSGTTCPWAGCCPGPRRWTFRSGSVRWEGSCCFHHSWRCSSPLAERKREERRTRLDGSARGRQSPRYCGVRFSRTASTPSAWSWVVKQRPWRAASRPRAPSRSSAVPRTSARLARP